MKATKMIGKRRSKDKEHYTNGMMHQDNTTSGEISLFTLFNALLMQFALTLRIRFQTRFHWS